MSKMFVNFSSLKNIDVSSFETSNIDNMSEIFINVIFN